MTEDRSLHFGIPLSLPAVLLCLCPSITATAFVCCWQVITDPTIFQRVTSAIIDSHEPKNGGVESFGVKNKLGWPEEARVSDDLFELVGSPYFARVAVEATSVADPSVHLQITLWLDHDAVLRTAGWAVGHR